LGNSLRIGKIFGITIRVHHLFLWMVAGMVLFFGPDAAILLGLLFLLVLLHELGHSLVAQSFGIRVLDITLWPLGGLARMSDIPQVPRTEAWIAVAGPAVNLALAALCMPLAIFIGFSPLGIGAGATLANFLSAFVMMNLMLGIFNLLPAFPMDGGRILRAFLARKREWVDATEIAVKVGRYVAFGFVVLWFFNLNAFMLPLIAAFVWITGTKELIAVRLRNGRAPFAFAGRGADFGSFEGQSEGNPFVDLFAAAAASRSGEAGNANPRDDSDPAPGGFSDADVEELERFRGRLRRGRD